jgi:hypothetical protein
LQNAVRTLAQQILRYRDTECFRRSGITEVSTFEQHRAVEIAYPAPQSQDIIFKFRERCQRDLAPALQTIVYRTLGPHPGGCLAVMQTLQQAMNTIIIHTAFNPDGTLPDRRQAITKIQPLPYSFFKIQPDQASRSQDDRVVVTVIQFSQPGTDVATQIQDLQVWPEMPDLALTTIAGSSHSRAGRQGVERLKIVGYQGVRRIFPWADHRQFEAGRKIDRHIFHGMNGYIRIAIKHGPFQFLDEQTLTPDLGQWRIQNLVALGSQSQKFYLQTWMLRLQPVFDEVCLP